MSRSSFVDENSASAMKGPNEYCNWSLVKRCCDVSEMRIEHRNKQSKLKTKKGMSRNEMQREKEDLDAKKPRHVLTTHGVLYMARLLKDMQDCAEGLGGGQVSRSLC